MEDLSAGWIAERVPCKLWIRIETIQEEAMRLSQMTIRGLMIGVVAASLSFAIVRLANEPDETVFLGTVTRIDNTGHTNNRLLS
jgi:hypothetical protein